MNYQQEKKRFELQIKSLLGVILQIHQHQVKFCGKEVKIVANHLLVTKMVGKSKHTNTYIIYICKSSVV